MVIESTHTILFLEDDERKVYKLISKLDKIDLFFNLETIKFEDSFILELTINQSDKDAVYIIMAKMDLIPLHHEVK